MAVNKELQLCAIETGEEWEEAGTGEELRRLQQLSEEQECKLRELTRSREDEGEKRMNEDSNETSPHRPSKSLSPRKTKRIDKSKSLRLSALDF